MLSTTSFWHGHAAQILTGLDLFCSVVSDLNSFLCSAIFPPKSNMNYGVEAIDRPASPIHKILAHDPQC